MAASGVIVKVGNEVLLCKRANICNFPGYWSIPAGAIEEGEMPFEAAERELFEETEIAIQGPLSFVTKTDGLRSRERGSEPFYIYQYNAPEILIPKLDFEHTEYGYFTLEDLPKPICENVIQAIKLCML